MIKVHITDHSNICQYSIIRFVVLQVMLYCYTRQFSITNVVSSRSEEMGPWYRAETQLFKQFPIGFPLAFIYVNRHCRDCLLQPRGYSFSEWINQSSFSFTLHRLPLISLFETPYFSASSRIWYISNYCNRAHISRKFFHTIAGVPSLLEEQRHAGEYHCVSISSNEIPCLRWPSDF